MHHQRFSFDPILLNSSQIKAVCFLALHPVLLSVFKEIITKFSTQKMIMTDKPCMYTDSTIKKTFPSLQSHRWRTGLPGQSLEMRLPTRSLQSTLSYPLHSFWWFNINPLTQHHNNHRNWTGHLQHVLTSITVGFCLRALKRLVYALNAPCMINTEQLSLSVMNMHN